MVAIAPGHARTTEATASGLVRYPVPVIIPYMCALRNMESILKAGFLMDSFQYLLADAASVPVMYALFLAVMTYPDRDISYHVNQPGYQVSTSLPPYRHCKSRPQHDQTFNHRTNLPRPFNSPILVSLRPEEIKEESPSKDKRNRDARKDVI